MKSRCEILTFLNVYCVCFWSYSHILFPQGGVVLVHCNAGVSRSSSIVIGYLMLREELSFHDAYSQVKLARPSIRPNPGFYQQLQKYKS